MKNMTTTPQIKKLRTVIAAARQFYHPVQHETLSLKPDRDKTGRELAREMMARLADIGLKPDDVLLRYVDDPHYIHTPDKEPREDYQALYEELGIQDAPLTWAMACRARSSLHIGKDWPDDTQRGYMVYRKDALFRIAHGQAAEAPFYIFTGPPEDAVVAKIWDGGTHPMGEPLPVATPKISRPARQRGPAFWDKLQL